jgi:hypothetical protein
MMQQVQLQQGMFNPQIIKNMNDFQQMQQIMLNNNNKNSYNYNNYMNTDDKFKRNNLNQNYS